MQLCNLEGKLLISNCRKSEEDSSFSLMWFGLKKKKLLCLLITSLISVAAVLQWQYKSVLLRCGSDCKGKARSPEI